MKIHDIRRRFLAYFEQRDHTVVRSSSLIPERDPTLFFTNAGMVQFKNVFSGEETRPYVRAASVQKCMRVSGKHNDLENVGFTPRHHTFFEMLGNFSFGDYFKRDAIRFGWDFLTGEMGLDPDRLLPTVFREDDEAFELWREIGVPAERIARCGRADNYWAMGDVGPHGPCSEIHWDLRDGFSPDHEPDPWGFGHDAGRYLEIWNLVFMQYFTAADGTTTDLPRPCVDTGMGLERLASVIQGVPTNYETDELARLVARACSIAAIDGEPDGDERTSLRVLADHARAAAFLMADGVLPSNVDRGYVLRRVMRRAIRHGVKLGIHRPFLHELVDETTTVMGPAYPELVTWRDKLVRYAEAEEQTFRRTLDRGLVLLEQTFAAMARGGDDTVPGEVVFELHSRDGFPPDLTRTIAAERGHSIDDEGYRALMERHRSISGGMGTGDAGPAPGTGTGFVAAAGAGGDGAVAATRFVGYDTTEHAGRVVALRVDGAAVDAAEAGTDADVVLDATPLYAESGGQVGDTGWMAADGVRVTVRDTVREGALTVHRAHVDEGVLRVGDRVDASVDAERRDDIRRNHSATHLLHAALRLELGTHVAQQGSVVDADRLRFDFSHFDALTDEQILAVERRVNAQVRRNAALVVTEMAYDDAVARGAMALFGEKYGDRVRVVEVPAFSIELCGGTHCRRTGDIGLIKIASEGSVGTGIRRIEAVTGRAAEDLVAALQDERRRLTSLVKGPASELVARVERLLDERRALRREIDDLKARVAAGAGGGGELRPVDVDGVAVIAGEIDADVRVLREQADRLLEGLGSGVVVLGARDASSARLVVKVSQDLADRVHAGRLVSQLAAGVGGKGGGRPTMAQAGGKDPAGLPDTLDRVPDLIRSLS